LARAAYENFFPGQIGFLKGTGGSSITQQLVKNVYISSEDRTERSIERKLKETIYAVELTNRYSKDQILEWYLNQIPYGGIYNGVEAAAVGYFGKSART
jgi:membrane peptidoglycan carboxypeptidase